jgi:hypothetical protein
MIIYQYIERNFGKVINNFIKNNCINKNYTKIFHYLCNENWQTGEEQAGCNFQTMVL